MNGNQRIKCALNGEWPDQRPVMLHNFMHAAKEAGFTMKQYYSSPQNAAKAHIQAVEKYKLDGILWDIDTAVLASAVGVPVDLPENEPARVHKPCLLNLEDVEKLEMPDISRNERVQVAVHGLKILHDYFGDEICLRGNADQAPFSLASMMRTPAEWMLDLIMDPGNAHRLLKFCTRVVIDFVKLLVESGAHMISNGDSPAGPEMISPDQYIEFAFPYEKEIVDYTHSLKLPYMLHICGNTEIILDEMKKLQPDAVELDYKTDIKKIFDRYSQDILLSGNIDPSGIIALGSREMVKQKTEDLLSIYRDSPRLIVNSGCAIPPNAPEENLRILIHTARNFNDNT
jgi:uroporphyrinogen decarboxylase